MLDLPFVEFLSRKKDLKEYFIKISEGHIHDIPYSQSRHEIIWAERSQLTKNIKKLLPDSGIDNHSRRWEGLPSTPNAMDELNVIYDNLVARYEKVNFTTNSVWHKVLSVESNNVLKENVVNHAIAHRIPNYINDQGPFVQLIEELRDRSFIREFRKKMDHLVDNDDSQSILALNRQLEVEFEQIRDILHNRILEKSRVFENAVSAVTLIPDFLGIPFVGSTVSAGLLINDISKIYRDKKFGWTGFLLDVKRMPFIRTGNSKDPICVNCGSKNLQDSKFCNQCGSGLK
jgi:hypothetical protein